MQSRIRLGIFSGLLLCVACSEAGDRADMAMAAPVAAAPVAASTPAGDAAGTGSAGLNPPLGGGTAPEMTATVTPAGGGVGVMGLPTMGGSSAEPAATDADVDAVTPTAMMPVAGSTAPTPTDAETMGMDDGAAGAAAAGDMTRSDTSCVEPGSTLDPARFDVEVENNIYSIEGDTLPGIRQQMTTRSPNSMAAATAWFVFWDFDWQRCDGSGLTLGLQVSYSMPEWQQPATAPPEVVMGWTGFIDALWCHEYGHTQFAVDLLKETYEALSALPTPRSCAELRRSAQAAFQPIYERQVAAETAYDRETNHGESMGARLCPDEDRTGCR